ncbi:MAG TPA: hypothetical protein VGM50_01570 [Gemmatimonadaceae bacterium]
MFSSRYVDAGAASADFDVDFALLQAVAWMERRIVGGVAHDLNSALQCLGDSLSSIRQDVMQVMNDPAAVRRVASGELATSMRLANEAFDRLNAVAVAVPNLAARVADETGPINLGLELLNIVALTAHEWRGRAQVVVDAEPNTAPFWCRWWVARLAILRLLLATIDAHGDARGDESAPLHLAGTRRDDIVEIRVWVDGTSGAREFRERAGHSDDAVLGLCIQRLEGSLVTGIGANGARETIVRFPVTRRTRTPLEAV